MPPELRNQANQMPVRESLVTGHGTGGGRGCAESSEGRGRGQLVPRWRPSGSQRE